jgi:hypothetical protein
MDWPAALGAESLAALRAHPEFRRTGDAVAEANVASLARMDDEARWLTADLGRASLCGALLMLDAFPGGATAQALFASAAANAVCSRGRVVSFLHYAQAKDRIAIAAGPEPWTQRRLVVSEAFQTPFRRMALDRMRAMGRMAPELAQAADRFEDPALYRRFMAALATMIGARRDLFGGPPGAMTLFMERHGGMDILRDLARSQPAERGGFLEAAPLSRSGLARRNNVSRTQVMRLLADAEAAGLLTATRDRVTFSQRLSDEAERHLAFTLQTARLAAAMALGRDQPSSA